MWEVEPSDSFQARYRAFWKKCQDEAEKTLDNLETIRQALESGVKPSQLKSGFIHREVNGTIAVDASGLKGRRRPRQARLYVYLCEQTQTIHLITIGGKDTQQRRDIPDCRAFMKKFQGRGEDG